MNTFTNSKQEIDAQKKLLMVNPFLEIPGCISQEFRKLVHNMRRRIRIQRAKNIANHTDAEWASLVAEFGGCCACCGTETRLVRDHIVPVYQGGHNGISNIQPLCVGCNSSKGSDQTDWRTA